MKYLLDSNIIIRMTMASGDILRARIAECDDGDLVTSAIVLAEVVYGSGQGKPPVLDHLRAFLAEVPVLDFDLKAAIVYASLPFPRASYDGLIAAHALSQELIIVTDNVTHFADVPGLQVENWTI